MIKTNQIKILQSACAGKFTDREERLESISDLIGYEISSFKDLTATQADDLIYFFNTGKMPSNESWALFDKYNTRHRTILSHCHTLGWKNEDNPAYVDLHRLGGWLKSKDRL